MLRAAIIGLGWWGRTLVESVQAASEVIRFHQGVTLDPGAVSAFAAQHRIDLVDSLAAVLADPTVDAIVLATPHSLHTSQIIAAAQAGKPVFSEKPLALNLADAKRAVEACEAARVVLAVGHDRRLLPAIREMKRLIMTGTLGELVHLEAQYSNDAMSRGLTGAWRAEDSEAPGGGMTGPGLHALDTLLFFGPPLRAVTGRLNEFKRWPNPIDSVGLLLEFAGGVTGLLGTVRGVPDYVRIQVFGTRGWAELRDFEWLTVGLSGAAPTRERFDPKLNTGLMLEHFARAVAGREPFPVTTQSMLETVAAFEACIHSIKSGLRVTTATLADA